MAVLMAVLKNIYIFAEKRTGPASNRHPTLANLRDPPLGIQPTKSARGLLPLRFRQGLALSRGRGISRYGEHPGTPKSVMTIEDCIDSACVFRWLDRRGQGVEPGGQHVLPVEAHLARPAFVGERDHIVVALINMIEQAENDLKDRAEAEGVSAIVVCVLDEFFSRLKKSKAPREELRLELRAHRGFPPKLDFLKRVSQVSDSSRSGIPAWG
jgi:hypothetical protein